YLVVVLYFCFCFFFQAEDGIRDRNVTGVQTCALPIFYRILFFFGIGIIVITVLGVVISMYFSMKNYNPIRGLLRSFTENTATSVSNEWSYIKYNITKTQSEHKLLNQRSEEHTSELQSR